MEGPQFEEEVPAETELKEDGMLAKIGQSKWGRAAVAAASITAGAAFVHESNTEQVSEQPIQMQMETQNENLSPSMAKGIHKFFPKLDLANVQVDRVRKEDGYSYVFSTTSGAPVGAISVNGTFVELRSAYEFDNGAINLGDSNDMPLYLNGVSDALSSIPASK